MLFPLQVAERVRKVIPHDMPLFVRISATDWAENGWDENDSIVYCNELKKLGVDLIDVSTGGNVSYATGNPFMSDQIPFAKLIKEKCDILTMAGGSVTDQIEANKIIVENKVDMV